MSTIGFLLAFVSVSAWAHSPDYCTTLLMAQDRKMINAIELIKLKPASEQPIHNSNPTEELTALSQANLQRLLTSLTMRLPIRDPDSVEHKRIAGLIAKIDFAALKILRGSSGDVQVPERDFYSHLVGGSRMVTFQWLATAKSSSLQNLSGHVYSDSARVHPALATATGFVLPQFSSAAGIIQFFQNWDPELVQELVKYNRYNLPASAWNVAEFLQYINPTRLSEIFPNHALYQRLSPLRRQLHRYLLTVPDAEIFFSALMIHFLSHSVESGTKTVDSVQREWAQMGGAGGLYKEALAAIGWEGSSLHIPLNVPPSYYSIVRRIETIIRAALDDSGRRRFSRPQRIDYKNMPDGPLNLR